MKHKTFGSGFGRRRTPLHTKRHTILVIVLADHFGEDVSGEIDNNTFPNITFPFFYDASKVALNWVTKSIIMMVQSYIFEVNNYFFVQRF